MRRQRRKGGDNPFKIDCSTKPLETSNVSLLNFSDYPTKKEESNYDLTIREYLNNKGISYGKNDLFKIKKIRILKETELPGFYNYSGVTINDDIVQLSFIDCNSNVLVININDILTKPPSESMVSYKYVITKYDSPDSLTAGKRRRRTNKKRMNKNIKNKSRKH